MSSEIDVFIEHARNKGMDHATIRMLLLSTGWKEKDIVEALAKTSLDLPIPAPPDSGSARETFLHLLATAALYSALVAAVVIFFTGIERLFPDATRPVWSENYERSTVRWSLAWLFVSLPLYLWINAVLLRGMLAKPERAWSGARRWLGHLTMFLAAIALGVDLIVLLQRMLEGELGTRFLLKVVVVLVLAGLMFGYFMISLRQAPDRPEARRFRRAFLGAAILVAGSALAWGFGIVGSPAEERARRLDDQRLDDLKEIRREIERLCLGTTIGYRREVRDLERPLPRSLEELKEAARHMRPDIVDPVSGELYGYEVTGVHSYRLGASFDLVRDEDDDAFWNHAPGLTWFEIDLLVD